MALATKYGSSEKDNFSQQPLFGETRKRDKIINIVIAGVTAVMVTITVILSIVSGRIKKNKCGLIHQKDTFCVYPMDIVFAAVILLLLIPQVLVVIWYRRGELEPKFRWMSYFNAIMTVLLCIVANLYFFQVAVSPSVSDPHYCYNGTQCTVPC
ncbi:PREDICTED: transmembrane protein 243-like [Amphimedon queenslandica]|uniref:Uncharacterized protein n=1 Tax=Amphimedon queenslandica TaxID=400682 RepID=A0A1X7UX19_AMPQE|nr:PREDICTED: transmembrane protein 243-like [Amphimedon queenslandica]|eukprot:XP_019851961.1 PREDICTED: transmembrane protein 243-like [Amphimedon queenslandica]